MNDDTQITGWLEKVGKFNDYLAGAPLGVLMFFFAIAVALMLRAWHPFPNRFIGPVIWLGCTVLFCLCAPRGELELRLWVGRNFLIGSIIGIAAYFLHGVIARRIPFFNQNDTTFTTKPDGTPPPNEN